MSERAKLAPPLAAARRLERALARVPGVALALALALGFHAALSIVYPAFFSLQVLANLAGGSAVLAIAALGAALVLLAGSIDLSVGSVVALASIALALALDRLALPAPLAVLLVALGGLLFGAAQGGCIHALALPPFLVTLAGMFLARGLALAAAPESIAIHDAQWARWTAAAIEPIEGFRLGPPAWIAAAVALASSWIVRSTRLGRNVLALGGEPEVALAFGVPVARTRIGVHALAGLLSALGGVAFALQSASASSTAGVGLELEAIAAAVVGGISLRGGRGAVEGALVGTAIFALIQEALLFHGGLAFGWARVAVGALLLAFLALHRLLAAAARRQRRARDWTPGAARD